MKILKSTKHEIPQARERYFPHLLMPAAFLAVCCGILLEAGINSCAKKENLITSTEFMMDTIVEIKIPDTEDISPSERESAVKAAFAEMRRIYDKYNAHSSNSVISELNSSVSYKPDEETKKLFLYAVNISSLSHGAFDASIFALEEKIWRPILSGKSSHLPSQQEVREVLKSTGMRKIRIEDDTISKPRDVKLDFGAFVKGYAVDRAVEVLKNHNIRNALVNAGGDLYCYGKKKWRIAIKHPRSDIRKKTYLGVITLSNTAAATSGDYERFVILDGKRYHHILNPATGFPASDSISVTIIAPTCMEADALSTAVFVAGSGEGAKILERYNPDGKKAEGLIVDNNGKFFMTEGFGKFNLAF